jgi:hypothetical protein
MVGFEKSEEEAIKQVEGEDFRVKFGVLSE